MTHEEEAEAVPVQNFDDLIIRPATNQDSERVIKLVSEVLAEHGLKFNPEGTDADLSDLEASYMRWGGIFELLEDHQGNLLGTAGLFPLDAETCELRKMYFVPQIRGRGLGRRMLERMLARAREAGFRRITLETASVLQTAVRLYRSAGFRPIETPHLSARCDQSYALDLHEAE
jgi:putative acetyltransferase